MGGPRPSGFGKHLLAPQWPVNGPHGPRGRATAKETALTLSHPITPLSAILALVLAWGGAAAAQETETDAPAEAQAAEAGDPLEGLSAETVIATVGDYDLTLGELIAVRQALPQQYQSLPPEVLKEGLMEQLVNQTVLAVRAREEGLDEAPEVALALRNLENSTLADSFMRRRMQERVTAEAIEEAYEARYEGAEPEQEVKAAHILVETKEEAEALRAEIEEGAEFAALAREHGTDGTAQRGGDLGWFVQGDMVPEFADAAFALEPGVVSEPVETPFGWHLILVEERRDRAAPPLEEVRQEIAQELAQQAQQEIIDEARGAVEITRPEREIPVEALMADELISGEVAE